MALGQLNIFGKDKVQVSLDRIREFEPKGGYYLAFSGGKDSIVCYHLLKEAGVKFDSHYNHTTVDPPELVKFIREKYPDVERHHPDTNMWKLIEKKLMPPTRIVRYCCSELKEGGGVGRFVVTGVRWAESSRRKNTRGTVEFDTFGSQSKKAKERREIFLNSDNDDRRKMMETCAIKGKHILNPIVDWEDSDVWEYIESRKIDYCSLYDEGYTRLGCIGCPMSGKGGMEKDFERYPRYKNGYIRAFDKMLKERERKGKETEWENGEEVFHWWISNS